MVGRVQIELDTIVEGTSKTAEVRKYGDESITTKKTETDEDNLLKLPDLITSEEWEDRRTFEWLQNFLRLYAPLHITRGIWNTNLDQVLL